MAAPSLPCDPRQAPCCCHSPDLTAWLSPTRSTSTSTARPEREAQTALGYSNCFHHSNCFYYSNSSSWVGTTETSKNYTYILNIYIFLKGRSHERFVLFLQGSSTLPTQPCSSQALCPCSGNTQILMAVVRVLSTHTGHGAAWMCPAFSAKAQHKGSKRGSQASSETAK